jgi:hypothetical protein
MQRAVWWQNSQGEIMRVFIVVPKYLEHTPFTNDAEEREDFKKIGDLVEACSKRSTLMPKAAIEYFLGIDPCAAIYSDHLGENDSCLATSLLFILGKRIGVTDIGPYGSLSGTLRPGDHFVVVYHHDNCLSAIDVFEITETCLLKTCHDFP